MWTIIHGLQHYCYATWARRQITANRLLKNWSILQKTLIPALLLVVWGNHRRSDSPHHRWIPRTMDHWLGKGVHVMTSSSNDELSVMWPQIRCKHSSRQIFSCEYTLVFYNNSLVSKCHQLNSLDRNVYFTTSTLLPDKQISDPIHAALTHYGRGKMSAISQTTFLNAISWMEMYEFRLRFHWNSFPMFELTIFQHWIR